MTAMVAEHPIRIGSGVWLDETGEQECCNHDTVARELTLKVRLSRTGLAAAQVLSDH